MSAIPPRPFGEWQRALLGRRLHSHVHATARLALEDHLALNCGENRVIFTNADVQAWVVLGATLANDDVAGDYDLAAILLYPEPATSSIPSIAG